MKTQSNSIFRKAGRFEAFLWMCAGADKEILEQCPGSDRVKYQGIGGIIFATGILAFISSTYAFWTVFSPKTQLALESSSHSSEAMQAMILSVLAGIVWGLVIFNIDRFIVSSTGSGDGTSAVTLDELWQATPRILMATLIGICLSTPLELRILKPEIDTHLHQKQELLRAELDIQTQAQFKDKKERLSDEITTLRSEIQDLKDIEENRRREIQDQRTKLELEAEGKSGSGKAGRGPAWRDKKENLDVLSAEFEDFKITNLGEIEDKKSEIEDKTNELENTRVEEKEAKQFNKQKAHQMDGLLARIEIAHEEGGAMKWILTLLLLSIELGPIFFKMMISKSTYDYLKEQKMELALAEQGLFFVTETMVDGEISKDGLFSSIGVGTPIKEKRYIKNVYLERHQQEMEKQLQLELALTAKVHAEYQRKMEEDISKNLDKYIQDS